MPEQLKSLQERVADWMLECFTPEIAADTLERNDRFIEESLELVQSLNYSADRAHALVDYVFGRDVGEPTQEVGGVMVTLAALCGPNKLDMIAAGEVEYNRINQPAIIEKIRAKQALKPTGSALPIPTDETRPAPDTDAVEALAGRLCEWSKASETEKPVPLMQEAAAMLRSIEPSITACVLSQPQSSADAVEAGARAMLDHQFGEGAYANSDVMINNAKPLITKILEAALSTQPDTRVEPVAWMYEDLQYGPCVQIPKPRADNKSISNIRPLYASPPPKAQVLETSGYAEDQLNAPRA